MRMFYDELPTAYADTVLDTSPTIVAPTYLRYTPEKNGFGVFAARDIKMTETSGVGAYIATYGGLICSGWETPTPNESYELQFITLKREPIYGVKCDESICGKNHHAYVDAADMGAGDGKFMNGGCHPNVKVKDVVRYRTVIEGVTVVNSILVFVVCR